MVGRRRSFCSFGWPTSTTASRAPASLTTSLSRFRPRQRLGMEVVRLVDEQGHGLPGPCGSGCAARARGARPGSGSTAPSRARGRRRAPSSGSGRVTRSLSTESDLATSTLPSRASSSWRRRTSTVLPAPTTPLSATRRPAWTAAFTCLTTCPVVLGLEEAGLVERRRQAVMLHHLAQHRPSPDRGAEKRARTRASTRSSREGLAQDGVDRGALLGREPAERHAQQVGDGALGLDRRGVDELPERIRIDEGPARRRGGPRLGGRSRARGGRRGPRGAPSASSPGRRCDRPARRARSAWCLR